MCFVCVEQQQKHDLFLDKELKTGAPVEFKNVIVYGSNFAVICCIIFS